jgi:NitT/TauT family transport system permease protein
MAECAAPGCGHPWRRGSCCTGASATSLRSPLATIAFLGKLASGKPFWVHLGETSRAFAGALLFAIVIGLSVGFLLGLNRFANEVLEPVLVAVYSIPKITLYPILLLMFGLGMSAKVAFGALHGVIPIALFTINAVRNVRPVLIKSARTMGLGPLATVREILLPAALLKSSRASGSASHSP